MNKIRYISALFILGIAAIFFCCKNKDPQKAFCAEVIFPNRTKIKCELALSYSQQALGLMFRRKLDNNAGMLFVFGEEKERTFWMKNTYIPLDIIFLDKKRKINKIFRGVEPYNEKMKDDQIPRARSLAKYVLEVSSGVSSLNNLKEEDKIEINFIYDKNMCD